MNKELRPSWGRLFAFNWKVGFFLILLICIPRFILVMNANATGNYGYIGLIMLLSAILPFVLLSKYGRKQIGITRPQCRWLLIAFMAGIAAGLFLHFVGQLLYGNTDENWYQYIGRSYKIPEAINEQDKAILFSIMALTGITFSPVGEELFFRGIVHAAFARSTGEKKAAIIDATAFALTHLSHFGLVFIAGAWKLLLMPAVIWVLGMFLVSLLFFRFKIYAGSLAGAIVCHAGFNLAMIYCIFYWL
jgi:hypothetical protein